MDNRVLVAISLVAIALAGCTGQEGDSADGAIKIVSMPADPLTEPLQLEALVSADAYEWKMGDGRPVVTGQTIDHVYGVSDGKFRIELTTTKGGEETTHAPLTIEFGSGQNSAPDFLMSIENQWVQVGEELTMGAFKSTDAEGDPILLQWFCQRQGDVQIATAGHHGAGAGSLTFGTGAAAAFPVESLNGTEAPAPDRTVSGDLCEGLSTGGFADESSVRGSFSQSGVYDITMAAKDPANANVATTATIYVTDFPRIEAQVSHPFSDTIEYGAPQEFDDAARNAEQTEHMRSHDFDIEFPILSVDISISDDGGVADSSEIVYEIRKDGNVKTAARSEDFSKGEAFYSPGSYTAWVYLRSGAQVQYDLSVEYVYETDPTLLFEVPHA